MATPSPEPLPSPLREIGANLIDDPGLWMEEALTELTRALKTFAPNLLGALALLLLGLAAAFVLRWLIHCFGKGLDAILTIVYGWMGQKVPRPRWSFSTLGGDIAFWITLAYGVSAAAE
jgi:hypothetical protein